MNPAWCFKTSVLYENDQTVSLTLFAYFMRQIAACTHAWMHGHTDTQLTTPLLVCLQQDGLPHTYGPYAVWRDGGAGWRALFIRGRRNRDKAMEPRLGNRRQSNLPDAVL